MSRAVRTTCAYCGVGCGLLVDRDADGVRVRGDADHPGSRGRLCVKGATLGQTVGLEGRLLHPIVRGERASWTRALDEVASGFTRIAREHGPDAVALYLSGQLLTEDYYAANKLGKGFLGTSQVDTNSRLCMSSSAAAYTRAFGGDLVPASYEDLDLAELIVWAGSNAAICHPVLFERALEARRERGAVLVTIDPRRTPTAEASDLHLAPRPGTDAALFRGLLAALERAGAIERAFTGAHTVGLDDALAAARGLDVARVAEATGIGAELVARFYALFAARARVVTAHSQGVHQWTFGTDSVGAILDCHLAKGAIGKPGAGPLSLTGQINAMGGREVGGLSTTLAAHMGFAPADVDRVARFWGAPSVAGAPGRTAVELFEAMERGEVKAIWIACTNPLASLPDAERARRALARCELVVVSELTAETETAARAHVLLPALGWGEKDGTITTSERRITRQRPFLDPPGDARPDWWMFAQVGRRIAPEAFSWSLPHEVFREHAALSAFENDGARVFDLGALASIDRAAYDALEPVQWPLPAGAAAGPARLFGDGRFATPDGRARLVATGPRAPAEPVTPAWPLALTTGRVREHWHTMTRTERVPALAEGAPEPRVELHPRDAAARAIAEGDLVRIRSARGAMIGRASLGAQVPEGLVFAPIHWREAVAPRGRVGPLMGAHLDPTSKQPETKHTPVEVELVRPAWEGCVVALRELALPPEVEVSVRVRGAGALRYELAGTARLVGPGAWSRALLGEDGAWVELNDPSAGRYRAVCVRDAQITAAVFLEPPATRARLPAREWLMARFTEPARHPGAAFALLAGGPPLRRAGGA
ncbi:MAG: molybdopterin-dependent oxidoreductase [Sandaracinaceae bacterium]|nr:molybdopterin-dependent oxidoreductase [Sandaracinaceae bacterium]